MSSMRKELRIALSGRKSIVLEDDAQPICIGSSTMDLEEENTFKKVGDYWEITYQGKRTLLRDITGARYIALLLEYPKRAFSVLELDATVRRGHIDETTKLGAAVMHDLIDEGADLTTAGETSDKILDRWAMQDYHARLRELAKTRASAEKDNDKVLLSEIDEETSQIQAVLHAAIGLGKSSRRFSSQTERARVNITRQIKSAIQRIAKDNPPLGSYLALNIKTGYNCQYSPMPGTPITWNL